MGIRCVFFILATVLAITGVDAEAVSPGLWKIFKYPVPDDLPVIYGGWSKAVNAEAPKYCVMIDVTYSDGSHDWAIKANFRRGTHDWEEARGVFVPKRPVAKLAVYAIFKSKGRALASGEVSFRDFYLERREGRSDEAPLLKLTNRPFDNSDETTVDVLDGRKVRRVVKTVPNSRPMSSPLASGHGEIWVEDSMCTVTPLTFPKADAKKSIRLSLARRERESAQLLISMAADAEWKDVVLEIPELKNAAGRTMAGSVTWQRQGYLARSCGAHRHPLAPPHGEKWLPDPLLPAAPFRVRPASTQGTWLTVFAAPEAEPGLYSGEVVVKSEGDVKGRVPISVDVLDFSLPRTFGLKTALSLMDGYIRAIYRTDFRAKKSEAIDLMLDHRLNPDDISRTSPPEMSDLLHARERGMSSFNILNVVPPPKDEKTVRVLTAKPDEIFTDAFYASFIGRVRPYVDELRRHGLAEMSYIYGFDESGREYYAGIADFWKKLRRDVPGIPLMTTAQTYRDFLAGNLDRQGLLVGDICCPPMFRYDEELSDWLRSQGKKVWWYTAGEPRYPYANFSSIENPPIEARLIGWMTWRKRADGFLYWLINDWRNGCRLGEDDTYFPLYSTYNHKGYPCGATLLYPGERHVLPSIRLSQLRDAVEDYEYLQLLAEKKGRAASDRAVDEIVKSMTDFSRSPADLRETRSRVAADICEGEPPAARLSHGRDR